MWKLALQINGITDDSRQIKPGYLFVAIKGVKHDGHDYLAEVAQKGALAVVSDQIEESPYLPVLQVKDVRVALATLMDWYYDSPSRKLKVVGVTGTNGKTTTTFMLDGIFQQNKYKTGLIGTVIVKIDQQERRANLTTPGCGELQETFAQMIRQGVEYVTMEVSSQGLAMHRVDHVDFDCGILTNLSLDHLDCHPTFVDYLNAKKKFFTMLGKKKAIFLNADDSLVLSMLKHTKSKVFTYGLEEKADFAGKEISLSNKGSSFSLQISKPLVNVRGETIQPQAFSIKLGVLGRHNIYNALAAAAVALYQGISPTVIQTALAGFQPVERRMEVIYNQEITILDDTALNPGSIDVVFQAVEKMNYHKLVVVNAIRGNRSVGVNRENARAIALWLRKLGVNALISTSSVGLVGPYDIVSPQEEMAFCEEIVSHGLNLHHYPSLNSALQSAVNNLKEGDLLLLLGAQGMDDGAKLALDLWKKKN